jgi:uncharacterized protein (TIGR03437 family)
MLDLESGLHQAVREAWRKPMNLIKLSMFGAVLSLCGLGFSDTAQGQTLTATPSSMSFTVPSGGGTATQQLQISSTIQAPTLIINLAGSPTWMTVNGYTAPATFTVNASNNPQVFTIGVNTAGLSNTQNGYTGTFTMQVNGVPSSLITYDVSLTLGGPSLLSTPPATQALSFSAVQGAAVGVPNAIPVTVTSSAQALVYTIAANTQTGGQWILLSTTSATTSSTAAGFQVYVNPSPAGVPLPVGTYTGSITLTSTTTTDTLNIPVTMSVTQGSSLNVTGTLNPFTYQFNSGQAGFTVQTQTLMISTTTGNVPYTTSVQSNQTTNWLVISPAASNVGTTPQALNFYLSEQYVAALAAGTYTINVTITAGTQTANVTATLIVSNNPLLTVNTKTLNFTIPFNTTTQPSQSVTVSSSNNSTNIPFIVQANASWLSVSPGSGSTATSPTFQVYVNPQALSISSTPYTGTVTVSPNNNDAGLYSITINVSVTITSSTTQIFAGPDQLVFSYQTNLGTSNLPQQLVALSSPSIVGFTLNTSTTAANNCPSGNWLSVSATQTLTPATLSIGVSTNGMTTGYCSGTVTVTYNNGATSGATLAIPVVVEIASASLLTVSPPLGFGVVTATYQTSGQISSSISINSTDGTPLQFTATASTPGSSVGWLNLANSAGTTQQNLIVNIFPSTLPVGVYTGTITINAVNTANLPSGPIVLPVTLTVAANTTVNVSPTTLAFTQAQGAAPPATQQISLTATGGNTTFTASVVPVTGGNWLQVSPLSGTANGGATALTVSVGQNSLSPGTYTSNISLVFGNSATPSATVSVKLTITAAQSIAVSPTSLSFSYQLGSTAPAAQTLNVTSQGGALPVTVAAASPGTNAGWLSVTPTSGSTFASGTPLPLSVSISPTGFNAAGTYTGTVTITPTNGVSPITVNVTLTVSGVPIPQLVTISNSASGAFGSISPGELITIKGSGIGPTTAVNFSVGAGNTVANTLGGVQVMFDGIAGTPTYVSATQVNVIVPYEIAGRTNTNVTLSYGGGTSASIPEAVASQAPGIYTFSATGSGQAAALNQNGTLNGPAAGLIINGQSVATTPAAQGSILALYMTGGGQTSPLSTTGTVTPTGTLYKIPGSVTATVNGVPATVVFAGAAPALVTGVIQVNLQLPTGVTGNNLSVVVNINSSLSLVGPTIAIQ